MAKQRVPQFGSVGKYVTVETDATVGAVLGVNLRNPDGSLVTAAQFGASPPSTGQTVVYWRTIQEIPANVSALANQGGTGLYVITASGESSTRSIQAVSGETTVANGDGVSGDPAVGLANLANSGAGTLQAITRDAKGRVSGARTATITGTSGQITVTNGTGEAGNPTISLAIVTNAGGGTLQKTDFDTRGRLTGSSEASTSDLPEGSNLYYTNARVAEYNSSNPYRIPVRTMAQLTSAASDLNMFLRVTDAPGGEAIVYSDGTDYRRVSDSSPVI